MIKLFPSFFDEIHFAVLFELTKRCITNRLCCEMVHCNFLSYLDTFFVSPHKLYVNFFLMPVPF